MHDAWAQSSMLGSAANIGGFTSTVTSGTTPGSIALFSSILPLSILGFNNTFSFGNGVSWTGAEIGTATVDYMISIEVTGAAGWVPVPAAVWLFGAALIGFVGMSRKTKVSWSSLRIRFQTPLLCGIFCGC